MLNPDTEFAIDRLGSSLTSSLQWLSKQDREGGVLNLAETWVNLIASGLQGARLNSPPHLDPSSPYLPFIETHRVRTDHFNVLGGGMRGGPTIDILFQIWFDTEEIVGGFGVPLVFRRIPSAGPRPAPIVEEIQDVARRLTVATPSARIVLFADQQDFDWGPTRAMRHHPILVVNAHSFAALRRPPHPVLGHAYFHFTTDLVSGWIGDPVLSGREETPVLDEVMMTFSVHHVLRLRIEREPMSPKVS